MTLHLFLLELCPWHTKNLLTPKAAVTNQHAASNLEINIFILKRGFLSCTFCQKGLIMPTILWFWFQELCTKTHHWLQPIYRWQPNHHKPMGLPQPINIRFWRLQPTKIRAWRLEWTDTNSYRIFIWFSPSLTIIMHIHGGITQIVIHEVLILGRMVVPWPISIGQWVHGTIPWRLTQIIQVEILL